MGGNSEEQKRFLASGAGSTAQIDFGEAGRGPDLGSLKFFAFLYSKSNEWQATRVLSTGSFVTKE